MTPSQLARSDKHDSLFHWSRWAFLPWAQKPQMRQAFTTVLSARFFNMKLRKPLSWAELCFQKKKHTATGGPGTVPSPAASLCLQRKALGFMPFPEGRHCHRGPCITSAKSQFVTSVVVWFGVTLHTLCGNNRPQWCSHSGATFSVLCCCAKCSHDIVLDYLCNVSAGESFDRQDCLIVICTEFIIAYSI